MRGLLVRIGADQSEAGGRFNAPVDGSTGKFCYVPVPEEPDRQIRPGMERPYTHVSDALSGFGVSLPTRLRLRNTHFDPDFEHLTYGDQGCKACRIWKKKDELDFIVFYAGLRDVDRNKRLVYAIVGFYWIEDIVKATTVPLRRCKENAHTRRARPDEGEIVVRAKRGQSGRLKRCIEIGSYRSSSRNPNGCHQYRVERKLLKEWGGLSVKDGWLQRNAYIPEFKNAEQFLDWFGQCSPCLISQNN